MTTQILFLLLGLALGQKLRVSPDPELLSFLSRIWHWVSAQSPAAARQVAAWVAQQSGVPLAAPPAAILSPAPAPDPDLMVIVEPVGRRTAAKAVKGDRVLKVEA